MIIMDDIKLIIKYKDMFICDKTYSEIDFIKIPSYVSSSDFYNIDIFVSLLCDGTLNDSYEATSGYTYEEGLEVFEVFVPELLTELESGVFLYDLDTLFVDLDKETVVRCEKNLERLPGGLRPFSYSELLNINNNFNSFKRDDSDEIVPTYFSCPEIFVNPNLMIILNSLYISRTEKDVLLLYSGGKDSALSAIRLRNLGYHVYFFHFDNGHMLDQNKPYLTFKNTFNPYDGYHFEYQNRAIDISDFFDDYFENWKDQYGNVLENGTLSSEIRCLSCRMAMYTKVFEYALEHKFKYVAEGARISQKFMIEQQPMIDKFKELASFYGIELLYPVLNLEDDEEEIKELLENGFSSKGWESKCLLGRKAKDKNLEDEQTILNYFDDVIKPNMVKNLKYSYDKSKV